MKRKEQPRKLHCGRVLRTVTRAPALHAGGHRFEPVILHQRSSLRTTFCFILLSMTTRTGLRLRCDHIDPEVRSAILEFAKWLRSQINFPIRVVAYIKLSQHIRNNSGELVSATFFAPYDKTVEPYIRVAAGDYCDLKKERGRDNALAAILHSLAHEIAHYEQWIKDANLNCGSATKRASSLIDRYAETREHP